MTQLEMRESFFEKERFGGQTFYDLCLLLLITIALVFKLRLAFSLKIGWDEFFFLSKVHSYLDDSLADRLQTFYVHFFTWLPLVSDNEVSQVVAARIVLYLAFAGSCLYTYLIARHFFCRTASLFSVLCYLSFSNIIVHGASFRADSISSFLFLFALHSIIVRSFSLLWTITAGIALALSLLVTIKSVFYLITISFVFFIWFFICEDRKNLTRQVVHLGLSFTIASTVFYILHTWSLADRNPIVPGFSLQSISSKVIVLNESLARFYYLLTSIYENILIWVILFFGLVLSLLRLSTRWRFLPSKNWVLIAFLFPILTVAFYRNSFPYYYVFILSPAIVLCGVVIHNVMNDLAGKGSNFLPFFLFFIILSVFGSFIFHYSKITSNNRSQFDLIKVVHQIFPEKVAYIDGCSAVSSFPKAGFFMSTWGMEKYLNINRPVMRDLLVEKNPVFLFANIPSLDLSLPRYNGFTAINYALIENDWVTLRENFIQHWSIIYVAGKKFTFDKGEDGPRRFEILVQGEYTYEGEGAAMIDGIRYEPGAVVELDRNIHTIEPLNSPSQLILRWGRHLYRPSQSPDSIPTFYGF